MSSQLEDSPNLDTIRLSGSDISINFDVITSSSEEANIVPAKIPVPKPLPPIPVQQAYPPFQLGIPITKPKKENIKPPSYFHAKIKSRTIRRIKTTAVYVEVLGIIAIYTLYAIWSFVWDDYADVISAIYNNSRYTFIFGICVWVEFYLAALILNIFLRYHYRGKIRIHVIIYMILTLLHISYHLVRWPIFINMITNGGTSSEIALFLDPIVEIPAGVIYVVVYLTMHYCA